MMSLQNYCNFSRGDSLT